MRYKLKTFVLTSLILVSVGLLFYFGVLNTMFSTTYIYNKNVTWNGLNWVAYSNHGFNTTSESWYNSGYCSQTLSSSVDVSNENALKLLYTTSTSYDRPCGGSISGYNLIMISNGLNVNSNLEKLTFNYNIVDTSASLPGNPSSENVGSSQIYLSNIDRDILIYSSPQLCDGSSCSHSFEKSGTITIYKNLDYYVIDNNGDKTIINLTGSGYELVLNTWGTGESAQARGTTSHTITISSLVKTDKQIIIPTTTTTTIPTTIIPTTIIPGQTTIIPTTSAPEDNTLTTYNPIVTSNAIIKRIVLNPNSISFWWYIIIGITFFAFVFVIYKSSKFKFRKKGRKK